MKRGASQTGRPEAGENWLAFYRRYESETIFACFNLSAKPVRLALPEDSTMQPLGGHPFSGAASEKGQVILPPYAAFFAKSF